MEIPKIAIDENRKFQETVSKIDETEKEAQNLYFLHSALVFDTTAL